MLYNTKIVNAIVVDNKNNKPTLGELIVVNHWNSG